MGGQCGGVDADRLLTRSVRRRQAVSLRACDKFSLMPIYPLNEWGVVSLRVTVFPADPDRRTDVTWWRDITGAEPESTSSTRSPLRALQHGVLEGGGRLHLIIDAARIEWQLTASAPTPNAVLDIVGDLPTALPRFLQLIRRWFAVPGRPAINRLALGFALQHPEPSTESAILRIGPYLPWLRLARQTSDFLLQVNRVTMSTAVPGLSVNRLSKWSTPVIQAVQISPTGLGAVREGYGAALEIDINTAPQAQLIADAVIAPLLDEFAAYATAIASDGDPE
jgi:hypothetical protein